MFKIRDLPNHPVTNKRQIALDFRSGFDAMEAQEKLDGYEYELVNGRQYTLHAKINKIEEYMRSESQSPEEWHLQDSWSALNMIANVSDGDMCRAHAKLDAQMELLKKQKLILDTEKQLLREKRKLKREYGCTEYDSENESSTSKRSKSRERRSRSRQNRSRSRDRRSRSRHNRSRSRDRRSRSRHIRSRSRDRRSRSRHNRSRSRDRRSRSRHNRSRSRDRRSSSRHNRSRSREHRSRPRHKRSRSRDSRSRHKRSRSRDSRSRHKRSRSRTSRRSKDRRSKLPQIEWHHDRTSKARELRSHSHERRSRSRSSDHKSKYRDPKDVRSRHVPRDRKRSKDRSRISRSTTSRERKYSRRSRSSSEEQSLIVRRSTSREHVTNANETRDRSDEIVVKRIRNDRRSRTPEGNRRLAIMSKSPERTKSPNKRRADSQGEGARTLPIENKRICIDAIKNKHGFNKKLNSNDANNYTDGNSIAEDSDHDDRANEKENEEKEREKRMDKKEKNKLHKCYRKKIKAEKLAARVEAITKDIMVVMLILLDEIIDYNDVKISNINKKLLDKRLEAIIKKRVEPLSRVKKDTDVTVLRKYKTLYLKKDDVAMLKNMLSEIPKEVLKGPQATVTSAEAAKGAIDYVATTDDSGEQDQCYMDRNNLELNKFEQNIEQSSVLANPEGQEQSKVIEIIDEFSINQSDPAKSNAVNQQNLASSEVNKENSSDNRAEVKKDDIVTIDLDSEEKPVPRRPMFVLIIRKLDKDMKKVIRSNNLQDEIKPGDIKHVLRFILKDLVKGQGYMTREEIMKKFRGIYPKNKDLTFVKNVIKDINGGKYPGLGPNLGAVGGTAVADNDCEDDVILIEKQYDVVNLTDSDDDDLVKKTTQMIESACRSTQQTTQNKPGPVLPANSGAKRPDVGIPNLNKPCPTTASESTDRPLIVARTLLVNRGLDMPSLDDNSSEDSTIAKNGLANPGSTETVQNNRQTSLFPGNLYPTQHGLANRAGYPSLASPINRGQANLKSANRGPAKSGSIKPGAISFKLPTKAKILPAICNPLLNPVNSNPACPNQAKLGPSMSGQNNQGANLGPAKTDLVNIKLNPSHHGLAKPRPIQPKCQTSKEQQISARPINLQQLDNNYEYTNYIINSIVMNESLNLREILTNLGAKEKIPDFFRIVEQVIKIRIEKILSEHPTTLNYKSAMERYRRSYSMDSNVTLVRDVYKNALGIELTNNVTNNNRETAEENKNSQNPTEISARDKQEEEKNNGNSLKVTAITITTSFNELMAKTFADETNAEPRETDATNGKEPGELIDNFKQELEFGDNEVFDNTKELESDKGPQVTSITIMTSEAELLSLSESEKNNEIRNENSLDNKAGESDGISDKVIESEQNINAVKELEQAIANSEIRLDSDKRPIDEEDETIESIVKFVSTLM